jgi:hypothetical protein
MGVGARLLGLSLSLFASSLLRFFASLALRSLG